MKRLNKEKKKEQGRIKQGRIGEETEKRRERSRIK